MNKATVLLNSCACPALKVPHYHLENHAVMEWHEYLVALRKWCADNRHRSFVEREDGGIEVSFPIDPSKAPL